MLKIKELYSGYNGVDIIKNVNSIYHLIHMSYYLIIIFI